MTELDGDKRDQTGESSENAFLHALNCEIMYLFSFKQIIRKK